MDWHRAFRLDNDDDEPWDPRDRNNTAGWFEAQLTLSLGIGVTSFLLFCFLRTRWQVVYMPRTKLKDFSPASAHWPDVHKVNRFFGWIGPTLRTSEYVVLQTVGLDAAVLLNFFRTAFLLFTVFAVIVSPLHFIKEPPKSSSTPDNVFSPIALPKNGTDTPPRWEIIVEPKTYDIVHLLFAYTFTVLMLMSLHRNFHRFVTSRQAFALQLIHSVPSRTVIVTDVPSHLRGDRALAEYFEGCGWDVESVSVCRHLRPLRMAIERRTDALLQLEASWVEWVGNPAKASGYSPNVYKKHDGQSSPLVPGLDNDGDETVDPETLRQRYGIIHSDRPRPTIRPHWFGAKVDAIEYWEDKFFAADEEVRSLRKTGQFPASQVAFVTFEDVKSAQSSSQVVHYREHSEMITNLAPEPRDVIWSRVSMPRRETEIRDVVVMAIMAVALGSGGVPVYFFSQFLSQKQLEKYAPWLAQLIISTPWLGPIVMNSLPALGLTLFNSIVPFFLEWLSYQQGFKSRSAAEYSLIRKYYLFLLLTVLFYFVAISTRNFFQEIADKPLSLPKRLAESFQDPRQRNFMISYVMLQGVGLMPLQTLNLGPLFTLVWGRLFAHTPRDYAEANAPPVINYGWVYPQALLVFTITLVYSVDSPYILVFGAIYFGMAYLVYKYKLLFIYFKPYESNGEAWNITFERLLWALVIFQLFMTGLFSARASFYCVIMMVPLLAFTMWWGYIMSRDFRPLSRYTALSSICEVERGEEVSTVAGIDETVSRSQSNLNHRRYAINDDTLYVAPADKRTDYSQPPMSNFYYGVLNTGRRRYAHPALSGKLPKPWLPSTDRPPAFGDGTAARRGIVLSLRRKVAKRLRRHQSQPAGEGTPLLPDDWVSGGPSRQSTEPGSTFGESTTNSSLENSRLGTDQSSDAAPRRSSLPVETWSTGSNPWRDPTPSPGLEPANRRLSFDPGSGIIALPDGNVWDDDPDDESPYDHGEQGEEPASPSTYFHRPNRRRTISTMTTATAV